MAESPNTNGYSFSWTQPYPNSMNWQLWVPPEFKDKSAGEIYQDLIVRDEMVRVEAVDNIVQNMLTYPDADAIMNKIRQKGEGND